MTTSTNPKHYYLTITLPDNKVALGRIIYVQPKAERYRPHSTRMDIVSPDWIEPDWYPASFTFAISGQTFQGRYMPLSYKLSDDGYTYYGIFELEQHDAESLPVA